ncbi:MAG TPA: transcriptional regulator [Actinomycetota bacterium]|nr:transcriptional regulator [Actinomycetota bacterium]
MVQPKLDEQLATLASLADPTRRRLYLYVSSRPQGAGREEAAEAAGISKALAAFHLDRLTADGLLVAGYRRLTGRSGPGAGRPSKIYQRSDRQVGVQLPPRNFELLARLLVQAALSAGELGSTEAMASAAGKLGTALGEHARTASGPRPTRERLLHALTGVLSDCGFEATMVGPDLVLRNCPFSPLSGEFTGVVCALNLALMQGVLEGLGLASFEACLDRQPGCCCVAFAPAGRPEAAPV